MTDNRTEGPTPKSEAENASSDLYYFDVARVSAFLRANFGTIILGAIAGLSIGLAYLLVTTPTSTATAQLLIDPGITRVLREQAPEQPMAMDSQQVETEIAVLRSEQISQSVIDSLGLAHEPDLAVTFLSDYLPAGWLSAETRAAVETDRAKKVLAAFQKNLAIRRIGVSYAIDIAYAAKDPDLAARIANGVAGAYMKFQIATRTKAAEVGSEWLKGRLGELRQSMNDAQRQLQEHRASQDYSISKVAGQRAGGDTGAVVARSTLEELESAATTNRQVYDSFLQAYVATVQRQSFPLSNATIITTASGSLVQTRSAVLVLALWSLLGAAVSAAAAYFRQPFSPAGLVETAKLAGSRAADALRSDPIYRH